MKKTLLLLVAGALAVSASAQVAKRSVLFSAANAGPNYRKAVDKPAAKAHTAAKTGSTSSCTYSETFPSTVLTVGGSGGLGAWTVGPTAGKTWKWINTASGSSFSAGPLKSSTGSGAGAADNGWMIFDGDSIRGTSTTLLPTGWLQSPAFNCTGMTTVGITFQELWEAGAQDSTAIQVSQDPTFATGVTTFPIYRNNELFTQNSTVNPDTMCINITSAAANHIVYVRFYYQDIMGFDFSWLIDDVCVGPMNTDDVGIYHSFMFEPLGVFNTSGAFNSSIYTTPLEFVDSVFPVTTLSNYGATLEPTTTLTAAISGPGSAYSQTQSYTGLAIMAFDSIVQFPGYLPNAIGTYTCTFTAALAGDADGSNNVQTDVFTVSDTTWMVNDLSKPSNFAYFVYGTTATSGSPTPVEQLQGARFDVPATSVGDTVSGFGVGFSSFSAVTNPGGTVMVQLYSNTQGSSGWTFLGQSYARGLTSADITGTSWSFFPTATNAGANGGDITPFVLQPNTTYAAIVQTSGVTTDVLVDATDAPDATYFSSGYFGQGGTSTDAGGAEFGVATDATGNTYVPDVRMYFGNIPRVNVGVKNVVAANSIGQAYPNPANTSFTVPFTMGQDAKVTVTLTNAIGQVISTQTINAIGGQASKATFATNVLADGMYIYTVQANGEHTNGQIVVAH